MKLRNKGRKQQAVSFTGARQMSIAMSCRLGDSHGWSAGTRDAVSLIFQAQRLWSLCRLSWLSPSLGELLVQRLRNLNLGLGSGTNLIGAPAGDLDGGAARSGEDHGMREAGAGAAEAQEARAHGGHGRVPPRRHRPARQAGRAHPGALHITAANTLSYKHSRLDLQDCSSSGPALAILKDAWYLSALPSYLSRSVTGWPVKCRCGA